MKWQKVSENPLPKDRAFLALWKGAFCIAEYDEDIDKFCICFLPAQYDVMIVSKEREHKFTHWVDVKYPKDY